MSFLWTLMKKMNTNIYSFFSSDVFIFFDGYSFQEKYYLKRINMI